MVGSPKSVLLFQATDEFKKAMLDWVIHEVDTQSLADQIEIIQLLLDEAGIKFPLACKPDIGCRGGGVRLVSNEEDMKDYLHSYPRGAAIMIQALSSWESEAGIF